MTKDLKKAQKVADKIAKHLHDAHSMEDEAMELADQIAPAGGSAQVAIFFRNLETAMADGRRVCAALGLNEGGKDG